MKGQSRVPFEFFFLKDEAGNNDSMLRKRCSEAAQEHKLNIDGLIASIYGLLSSLRYRSKIDQFQFKRATATTKQSF